MHWNINCNQQAKRFQKLTPDTTSNPDNQKSLYYQVSFIHLDISCADTFILADEMVEQIRSENHRFVFLHCFGVNGSEKEFAEAVGTQSKYVHLIAR